MRSVETEGATIDDAIGRALELLHIERDKVDVEIIENAARGVLGFGGKKARIRATVRSPLAAQYGADRGDGGERRVRDASGAGQGAQRGTTA